MWTYERARAYVTSALRADAEAQESGRAGEIGTTFDDFDANLPRSDRSEFQKLYAALRFWDEWIYARDHNWLTPVPVSEQEWPQRARFIASRIESDENVTDLTDDFYF
ncbi:MAG: hypothetical protein AAF170_18775 [Bacteroidota bacterium]